MSQDRSEGARRALLTGWGHGPPTAAELIDVDAAGLPAAIKALPVRGGIARGLGRSYGDPARNAGGHVLRLAPDRSIRLDQASGTVTVGGGISLDDLMRSVVPRGWFVPVTPGTRFVTVGGAIASDIHGKNHHVDGSFGDHVRRLRLMLADTTMAELGPDRESDLFWATVGGMGLTGVILDATIALLPIETSRMSVDTYRLDDLDAVMEQMTATEHEARYSVAWLDVAARGRHLGRGVLTNGDHSRLDELDARDAIDPLVHDPGQRLRVPPIVPPNGLVNRATVAAFNELWFRKSPRRAHRVPQSLTGFFHPLDGVADWNRVYGRRGFVQYQFVVPHGADAVVRTVVERTSASRAPVFLTVLKRFGPGNDGHLSFPTAGWTLAMDLPASFDGLPALVRSFDELVLAAGGRHYLAKDFQTTPDAIRRGYPRLDEWRSIRRRVDPTGVWASDLSRRLRLTP